MNNKINEFLTKVKTDEKLMLKLNITLFFGLLLFIFFFIRLCFTTLDNAKFSQPSSFINVVKFIDKFTNRVFSSRLSYIDKIAIAKNTQDCYWIESIDIDDENAIDMYKYYRTFQEDSYKSKKLEIIEKIITLRPQQPIWYYERINLKKDDAPVNEIIDDYEKIISLMKKGQIEIDTNNLVYSGGKYNGKKKYITDIYMDYYRYLSMNRSSDLITDDMLLDIGNKAVERTILISVCDYSRFEISRIRYELAEIYQKRNFIWGVTSNLTHAILVDPFNEYNIAYSKFGSICELGTNLGRAFYSLSSCVKSSSSFGDCERAIELNTIARTGLTFIPYVKLGDMNFKLKDYKSAVINYEKALKELNYNNNLNYDDVSIYDWLNYKDLIEKDIMERINRVNKINE